MIVTKARIVELFGEQIKRVLALKYPQIVGKRTTDFLADINPLWDQIEKLEENMEMEGHHFPIALVIPFSVVNVRRQINSILSADKTTPKFTLLGNEDIQDLLGAEHGNKPYLILDMRRDGNSYHPLIDTSVDVNDWYFHLGVTGRLPLTVEEGLALFTHFEINPGVHGIALLGSRARRCSMPNIVARDNVLGIELSADEELYESVPYWEAVSCKKRLYSR